MEFSERNGHSKKELISLINQTVATALDIIASIDETTLLKVRPVQTYSFSGVQVLIHATEHFSYHTGQIAFWTKYLTNKDLGFYAHQDLNRKDRWDAWNPYSSSSHKNQLPMASKEEWSALDL